MSEIIRFHKYDTYIDVQRICIPEIPRIGEFVDVKDLIVTQIDRKPNNRFIGRVNDVRWEINLSGVYIIHIHLGD
jgi:hypothetical protein